MSKAHEILLQPADQQQIRRWAEGNALVLETRQDGYFADFLYSDGSMISYVGQTASAHA